MAIVFDVLMAVFLLKKNSDFVSCYIFIVLFTKRLHDLFLYTLMLVQLARLE